MEYDDLPWHGKEKHRQEKRRIWRYVDSNGKTRKGGAKQGRGLLQVAEVGKHISPLVRRGAFSEELMDNLGCFRWGRPLADVRQTAGHDMARERMDGWTFVK